MKRVFDFTLSLLALIILSPLFIIVFLIIKLTDHGPVFFTQNRIGLSGFEFKIFKFRSMKIDADKLGPYYTADNDERITKIGKYLRRSSIDELPQLINVLKGDMSLVGPRPNVLSQKELYQPQDWNKRNTVLPGITGLAQASIRSDGTPEKRLELDLFYVDHMSFLFDIKIILMTIKQIVKKGGN